MFKSHKMVYALSLVLGGIGFISTLFITSQYVLFFSYLLIGCAWAAMLAMPFTILTNSLSGTNMGTYVIRKTKCSAFSKRNVQKDKTKRPLRLLFGS